MCSKILETHLPRFWASCATGLMIWHRHYNAVLPIVFDLLFTVIAYIYNMAVTNTFWQHMHFSLLFFHCSLVGSFYLFIRHLLLLFASLEYFFLITNITNGSFRFAVQKKVNFSYNFSYRICSNFVSSMKRYARPFPNLQMISNANAKELDIN